jgi:hypothetical protein
MEQTRRKGGISMNLRDNRTATALGLVVAGLLIAAPATAAFIQIGGIDAESQYTGAGSGSPDAGIFTFFDSFNSTNDPEFGVVDSENLAGFDLIGGRVGFEAILSATGNNGLTFNPATDNVRRARFVGTGGSEFWILDPNDNTTPLLVFDLNYIDVTTAALAAPPADPDGLIVLGDLTPTATTSLLTVSGGTLNAVVGGFGTPAVLSITMSTIAPPLLVKADLRGYLNTNFWSGTTAPPVGTTNWNLTIIPEPSTAVLLGFALLGVLATARRGARR